MFLWSEVIREGGDTLKIDYQPPVLGLPPTITIGEAFGLLGSLSWELLGLGSGTGTYDFQLRYPRVEPVEVPFGAFQAIVEEVDLVGVFVSPGGGSTSIIGTTRTWGVPGLGTVRSETLADGGGRLVAELLDTNRQLVPEPTALLGELLALAAVLMVWSGRSSLART